MIAQHYKLQVYRKDAKAGQLVYEDNNSNSVIGFVDFISDCELAIMLFEPTEFPDDWDGILIDEECDYFTRLAEIMDQDPEIKDMWLELALL